MLEIFAIQHAQGFLMSQSDPEPMASLGGHGNNHLTVGYYIPLANGIVQLHRTAFLAMIKVVPVKYRCQYHPHFTARKVLATVKQLEGG